jgi:hypothetical protein
MADNEEELVDYDEEEVRLGGEDIHACAATAKTSPWPVC